MNADSTQYLGYAQWKQWHDFFSYSDADAAYFEGEFAEFAFRDRDVLEVGYGRGAFLAWAKSKGARVMGVEISNDLVRIGAECGYDVTTYEDFMKFQPGTLQDLIVGLDVLEHLDVEKLSALLRRSNDILKQGGSILFRFPNGLSPFGRLHQHGDITHVQTVTPLKIGQLLANTDLRIIEHRNPFIAQDTPWTPFGFLKHKCRLILKNVVSKAIAGIYGGTSILDPNTVVVLQKGVGR